MPVVYSVSAWELISMIVYTENDLHENLGEWGHIGSCKDRNSNLHSPVAQGQRSLVLNGPLFPVPVHS